MLNILASGTLVSDPRHRTSAAGKAFATAEIRVPAEDADPVLVSHHRLQRGRRSGAPGACKGRLRRDCRPGQAHELGEEWRAAAWLERDRRSSADGLRCRQGEEGRARSRGRRGMSAAGIMQPAADDGLALTLTDPGGTRQGGGLPQRQTRSGIDQGAG